MEAEDIVKERHYELQKQFPKKQASSEREQEMEKRSMDVIKKFHEVENMYESIEWAKAFEPAVKEGETKISDLV